MKQSDFDIIATINPQTVTPEYLNTLIQYGATLIRLNGSFLTPDQIMAAVAFIRDVAANEAAIILDLPGFKPRFTGLDKAVRYQSGNALRLPATSINHPGILDQMTKGDTIRLNDGTVRFLVQEIHQDGITFVPDLDGVLRPGKGFHMVKNGYRPQDRCTTAKDEELIQVAKLTGIEYVGLSFVHDVADVLAVNRLLEGSQVRCIPKIEARESVQPENLRSILAACDKVIVDRGDMASEIGLERIWMQQRNILGLSRLMDCRVIMATQFLSGMISSPLPSIAEIDSLNDLLRLGINGVQLSEETSVGGYGTETVRLISTTLKQVRDEKADTTRKGKIVWIMGPTSSGKTTLAAGLAERLGELNVPVVHYDGDEFRNMFGPDFPFEHHHRLLVVKALVHHAAKAANLGLNVIVSAVTLSEESRAYVFENLSPLTVAYLDCPIDICADRDPKGLYAKAKKGEISSMPGVNLPYPPPERKDIVIQTGEKPVEACRDELLRYLIAQGRVNVL